MFHKINIYDMIRHASTIHKDLQSLGVSIVPEGNVPLNQTYDEETRSYIPDHGIIPLILVPEVRYEGEDVSTEYEERGWWRITANGAEEQITAATSGHTLYPTGFPLGLKITGNISATDVAKYIFRVKARGVRGSGSVTLRTNMAASAMPSLELDAPPAIIWDPFTTDHDVLKITPTVNARGKTCTVRWRKIVGGVRRAISATDLDDLELSVNTATNVLSVNRRWMGNGVSVVCELLCGGEIIRERYVTIRRRIPPHRDEILTSDLFTASDAIQHAELVVRKEPSGIISNPEAELKIDWYDCDGTNPVYVGSGVSHDFPLDGEATRKEIGVEVTDRGPWLCLKDASGAYLTDASGAALITR